MKTRDEVEHLKANLIADPCYDLEETEGFEEYREELFDFSEKRKIICEERFQKEKKRILQEAKVSCVDDLRYNGLTKRELFAAMALQGMQGNTNYKWEPEAMAEDAVKYADALINELNKETM